MSNYLANYFAEQAAWRDIKAEEYPEDERNAQSADALRSLSEFVGQTSKPGEHEARNAVLSLEPFTYGTGVFQPGDEALHDVSRYGYGYPVTEASHIEFLEELWVLCVEGAYEHVSDHEPIHDDEKSDPSRVLYDFEIEAAREGIVLAPQYFRRRAKSTEAELEEWVQDARTADGGAE